MHRQDSACTCRMDIETLVCIEHSLSGYRIDFARNRIHVKTGEPRALTQSLQGGAWAFISNGARTVRRPDIRALLPTSTPPVPP